MRVLVTGAGGQLGRALCGRVPGGVEIIAAAHGDLDITDAVQVGNAIRRQRPGLIINAAAYTDVERAESEPGAAHRVNADGAGNVAAACAEAGIRMIHVSTDYVFDGEKDAPYLPADAPAPINEYGRSKLEGERRVTETDGLDATIVRTSWVYGAGGNNFVTKILGAMQSRPALRIVSDQTGVPTWTGSLADAIWAIARFANAPKICHYCDRGTTNWHEFTLAIMDEALALKLLAAPVDVNAIPSSEYPTAARRPRYSVLDATGVESVPGLKRPHWRDALRSMLQEVAAA